MGETRRKQAFFDRYDAGGIRPSADIHQILRLLGAIFRVREARRNEIRSQPSVDSQHGETLGLLEGPGLVHRGVRYRGSDAWRACRALSHLAQDACRIDPALTIADIRRVSVQLGFALPSPCVRAVVSSTRMVEGGR